MWNTLHPQKVYGVESGGGEGDDEVSERTNIGFFKHGMSRNKIISSKFIF